MFLEYVTYECAACVRRPCALCAMAHPILMGAKARSSWDHQSDPLVSWLGQTSGAVLSGQSAPLGSWLAPDNAICREYPTLPVCPLAPD